MYGRRGYSRSYRRGYSRSVKPVKYSNETYNSNITYTSVGWELFENDGQNVEYNGREITVREDGENWYVNFNTGLGEGIYQKADWTLQKAINDQANIYKEI